MSRKGGYLVIDLKNKNLNSSPVIEGIYDLIEGNYGKSILLSGITISNVEKADVFTKPDVSSSTFVFKNVYGYDISVNDEDQVSIASTEFATKTYVGNTIDDKIDTLLEGDRIDDKIESLVEGGTLDNAKPIYCHPITIDDDNSDNKVHIAMLIFDNSNEEYNTLSKLIAKLEAIFTSNSSAIFPTTGAIYFSQTSALHVAQKIAKSVDTIYIYTSRPDGTQGNFNISTYLSDSTIYDGVNKVN